MNKLKNLWLIGAIILVGCIILAHIFLIRPWYMRWGATDQEIHMPLPGDSIIPKTAEISTRAITIQAPVATVWQWLVQIGQGRGGFYSNDWLENIFAADMHNAERIMPELQQLKVGDRVALAFYGGPTTHLSVLILEPERALVLERGWIFFLQPISPDATRLIVRYAFDVGNPGNALYYYPLFEQAHFVMESGMMLGLKRRAERSP
jgi:hypothetical protein